MRREVERAEPEVQSRPGDWMALVRRNIESLRYGVVQIVVHDSRIVQVERTERIRLEGSHLSSEEA